jgi:hypothetical protein
MTAPPPLASSRQRDFWPPADSLIGLHARCERAADWRQPCHDNVVEIAAGRGCHAYALLCAECGQFRGWLPKKRRQFSHQCHRRVRRPARAGDLSRRHQREGRWRLRQTHRFLWRAP